MNSIKYWTQRLLRDAFLFGTLFYWQVYDVEGIGEVFMVAIWTINLIGIASLFMGYSASAAKIVQNRPIGAFSYNILSKTTLLVLLGYFGLFFTAGTFSIAWVGAKLLVTEPNTGNNT